LRLRATQTATTSHGRGVSRFLLQRFSLNRTRALAAVTSHETENISIAVAALGV
jgi:Trk K+ transport system NAD-binding subunit